MQVILLHQTISKYDAIGTDIFHMYQLLNASVRCRVYCKNLLNTSLLNFNKDELLKVIKENDTILMYHHSIWWEEGEEILEAARCRVIIKYHNITPPEFFKPYSQLYSDSMAKGRAQTARFAEKFTHAHWLCDSIYNMTDITTVAENRKTVLAPFTNIEQWNSVAPDNNTIKQLIGSRDIQVLFVGRIAPNKNHLFLLEVLREYVQHYNKNIVLHIIGKEDAEIHQYNREIKQLIAAFHLQNNVKFIHEVTDQFLLAYYLGCDVYVNCSEHEGFCVPLIESQFLYLPVIAKSSSAVPETVGNNQVVLGNNPAEYAAAIKLIAGNDEVRNYLTREGYNNYSSRFRFDILTNKFKDSMKLCAGIDLL